MFLRGELKYEKDAERRQKAFHRNDDMHISVKELWEAWVKSEVHNWTVEQTADWLASSVELPQYVPLFIIKRVTGTHLPRLASSNGQYITNTLGIKDPIHRQKIMLKAMDVVLFGPPKENVSYTKDLILTTLLMLATIGCYYAYRQYRSSKNHLERMVLDMESLQKAELNYQNLQKELERAKQEQEYAATEKQNLEKRLKEQAVDGSDLHNSNYSLEVTQLKEEIELLRNALQRAEGELVDRYWSPPPGLQLWMQLTHEIENKAYSAKKVAAEKQLQAARDACEKLRRKRSSLVGAFVSTHGKSIDDVDRSIVDARTALNEVTQELAERVHRWKQIESLCGFTIINNKGLSYLESVLYKNSVNGRNLGFRGRMSSQDNLDDETSSNYSVPTGISYTDRPAFENFSSWTEGHETSDSDKLEQEDEEDCSRSNVHFIVGASELDDHSRKNNYVAANSAVKDRELHNSSFKSYNRTVKPVAEEHNGVSHESEISKKSNPLLASSEHSTSAEHVPKVRRPPRRNELAHSASVSTTSTMDDEAGSTDSNSNSAPIDDALPVEPKKTKSKLKMFPRFGRKISKNNSASHAHTE
ncbi:hypothetical protein V9T40_006073 [Parthenolecanium corni]|uniref:SAM domain-containing protein n=1 Tax=Parthenolecanium corni TaxID=536013 RepID=A0AAN9TW47_9HEMI